MSLHRDIRIFFLRAKEGETRDEERKALKSMLFFYINIVLTEYKLYMTAA